MALINNPKKNWEEDFEHENGNYLNNCCECNQQFLGHKRRVICKECFNDFDPIEMRTGITFHRMDICIPRRNNWQSKRGRIIFEKNDDPWEEIQARQVMINKYLSKKANDNKIISLL